MIFVSMVGDFDSNILPLFFHHIKDIHIHILIFDKRHKDKQHAIQLTKGIKTFCERHNYNPTLLEMSFDEDSIDSIENIYLRIKNLSKNNETIYFNASDGLASTLAILQPMISENDNAILAYDRFENTCNILFKGKLTVSAIAPMSIREHLTLKNIAYQIPNQTILRKRKHIVLELMKDMKEYTKFKTAYKRKKDLSSYTTIIKKLQSINKHNDEFFIVGGILEEYCYWLVKDLGFDDVQIGSKVTVKPNEKHSFKNELDILMIKDNHLNIIECKYNVGNSSNEQFIYKYHSVQNLIDEDAKVMIVSVGIQNMQYSKQFNKGVRNRARHNNIYIYHHETLNQNNFKEEVKSFFLIHKEDTHARSI